MAHALVYQASANRRLSVEDGANVMDIEELDPVKKKLVKKDLTRMSVGDLKEYIAELKGEIERSEAAINSKDKARAGAELFFKS